MFLFIDDDASISEEVVQDTAVDVSRQKKGQHVSRSSSTGEKHLSASGDHTYSSPPAKALNLSSSGTISPPFTKLWFL